MTFSVTNRREPTQNERILALLADGRWHTTRQILQAVPCIVHSRVAEINARQGYRIEHDGAGGGAENHRYRLVSTPGAESPQGQGLAVSALDATQEFDRSGVASLSAPGTEADVATDGPPFVPSVPAQLSVFDEAAA